MDALSRACDLIVIGLIIVFVAGVTIYGVPKAPKYQEPLCTDPFASRDLNEQVYTWCKNVPMWSTKA